MEVDGHKPELESYAPIMTFEQSVSLRGLVDEIYKRQDNRTFTILHKIANVAINHE